MARLAHDVRLKELGFRGRITSLRPLRPANAPDPWETRALRELERGRKEFSEVVAADGVREMRLMAALVTTRACLECHAHQGYREGEVRGGISVSVPVDSFWSTAGSQHGVVSASGLVGLWALGLAGIGVGVRLRDRRLAEHEQAQAVLRHSEEHFRQLVERSPAGIMLMRPDQTFEYFNPRLVELFGYTLRELPDKETWFQRVYPDPAYREQVRARWLADLQSLAPGPRPREATVTVRCKDGADKTAHVRSLVLDDGRHLLWYEDITERRQAEEALRRSEERFAKAFRASPDAVILLRLADERIQDVNDSFALLTGYPTAEVLGKTTLELQLWADPARREAFLAECRAHGRVSGHEARFRLKSGEVRACSVSSETVVLHGEPCLLSVARDITERKRAEEERERLIRELQEALANVRTLRGLLPICAACKKVRDDRGYWKRIETYIGQHSDATFTHGICPECAEKLYGELADNLSWGAPAS